MAIVGVEKLVAHFADIRPFCTALPRSATAQLLTSYVSVITGPSPNTDGSLKDLHIVLMDSHRTEMAADPMFKEALQCIRCASCLNVCPVFRLVGGHVFGKTYTGGIGTILTAWFDELKRSEDIQSLCIQCGNCVDVCPGKVPIPDMILELRRRMVQEQGHVVEGKGGVRNRQQPAAVSHHAAGGVDSAKAVRQGRIHPPPTDVPVGTCASSAACRRWRKSLSAIASRRSRSRESRRRRSRFTPAA